MPNIFRTRSDKAEIHAIAGMGGVTCIREFHANNRKNKMTIVKKIDIGNDVWGHAYEIELNRQIKSELEIVEILDEFCSNKELKELSHNWNKINFDEAKRLLRNCLTFDIAYSSCRISEEETVEKN